MILAESTVVVVFYYTDYAFYAIVVPKAGYIINALHTLNPNAITYKPGVFVCGRGGVKRVKPHSLIKPKKQ